ncbi:hypothetical protein SASPL_145198 [Salvia splendens]|uniref:Uncharacterized protein n=1 Tax=Salvia splendens TaxID=180675 RepID=A0A8X8WHT1_SALSN|nr:hypothetical protein SASPL_145198 [Salvia splendens]
MTNQFIKGMDLGQPSMSIEPLIGAGNSSHISIAALSMQRHDGRIQSFSVGEAGSNPAIHGYAHQSYLTPHLALKEDIEGTTRLKKEVDLRVDIA